MTQPMPDFAAARRAMIDSQLRPQGVSDPAVLAAMGSVPREQFRARELLGRSLIPIGRWTLAMARR